MAMKARLNSRKSSGATSEKSDTPTIESARGRWGVGPPYGWVGGWAWPSLSVLERVYRYSGTRAHCKKKRKMHFSLLYTSTSCSPAGIRQGYKFEASYYIMQADIGIYLFSRLTSFTPKATSFELSLSPCHLSSFQKFVMVPCTSVQALFQCIR